MKKKLNVWNLLLWKANNNLLLSKEQLLDNQYGNDKKSSKNYKFEELPDAKPTKMFEIQNLKPLDRSNVLYTRFQNQLDSDENIYALYLPDKKSTLLAAQHVVLIL